MAAVYEHSRARLRRKRTYVVLVAIGADRIAHLLGGRLLALQRQATSQSMSGCGVERKTKTYLGLEGRRDGVAGSLQLVTHMLGGSLLRVGLRHEQC